MDKVPIEGLDLKVPIMGLEVWGHLSLKKKVLNDESCKVVSSSLWLEHMNQIQSFLQSLTHLLYLHAFL